jgi:hypothetical protein
VNTENLTPASVKAIEDGGTNNAVIGRALVKRGVMVEQADVTRSIIPFKFVLSAEYVTSTETHFAETMTAEEDAQESAGTSEAWQIAQWNEDEKNREIGALRTEFEDADDDRREEIRVRLFELGTVVYPEGSPQHEQYAADLKAALADPNAFNFLDLEPAVNGPIIETASDAEAILADAIDRDDAEAIAEILPEVNVIVRDPKEKRYAYVGSWTDENLLIKEEILRRRLARKTLLRGDREQAERHLRHVAGEIKARGLDS